MWTIGTEVNPMMIGLQKMAIRMEIADIKNRDRSVSLWVIDFTKKNSRRPTDQECQEAIDKLLKDLEEIVDDTGTN